MKYNGIKNNLISIRLIVYAEVQKALYAEGILNGAFSINTNE